MTVARLHERYAVADVDCHLIEPPDLWTSRVSSKWADMVPHVKFDPKTEEERWYVGNRRLFGVGALAMAGWPEYPPSHPKSMAEIDPAHYEPKARLAHLDEVGVYYQVLHSNILGFNSHVFIEEMDRELANECVRAYNDFLIEWCSADPKRLVPLMMLPFWDVEASAAEIAGPCARSGRGGRRSSTRSVSNVRS